MKKIKNILFTIGIGIIALPKKVFGMQTTTIENYWKPNRLWSRNIKCEKYDYCNNSRGY